MDSIRNRRNYGNEIPQFSLSSAYIQKERKTKFLKLLSSQLYRKREKKKEFLLISKNSSSGLYIEKRRNNGKRLIVLAGEIRKKKKLSRGAIQKEEKEIQRKTFFYSIYRKSKYIRKASWPEKYRKLPSLYIQKERNFRQAFLPRNAKAVGLPRLRDELPIRQKKIKESFRQNFLTRNQLNSHIFSNRVQYDRFNSHSINLA